MKISVLLPYKENFSSINAGAVSLFVKDTIQNSKFFKSSFIFGNMTNQKPFLKNYVNIELNKSFIRSNSKNYVIKFLEKEKKINSDIIEIHNRPNYIKFLNKLQNKKIILYFHNDPLSMNGSRTESERDYLIKNVDKMDSFYRNVLNMKELSELGFVYDNIDLSGLGMVGFTHDISQIEVFKGPQSSVYGANAIAGLISIHSNNPTDNLKIESSIHLGSDNHLGMSALLSNKITDNSAFRLSGVFNRSDGFSNNISKNRTDTNSKQESLLRMKLNLYTNQHKNINHTSHIDFEEKTKEDVKIGLLNFTNCNGGTKINKKIYKSNSNELIVFDNKKKHNGITQSDTPNRIILNIGWK